MRRREEVVLWPSYFDLALTRAQGRRVPKKICKESPTVEMIGEAARKLNLPYKIVSDAAYPRFPCRKTGLVLVKKVKLKGQILQEIAKEISRFHT